MMTHPWAFDQVFYHIYPLGLCGAPRRNDFHSAPVPRLDLLYFWLDHLQELGVTALYLGPLFESSAHGYDTADYFQVDRRLGDRQTLAALSKEIHHRGMRLVLDGVFNHTGRDFWAFKEIRAQGSASPYVSWYHRIDFSQRSPAGDPFSYEGWAGNYDLVKLNLAHPAVREHLFSAVTSWLENYEIDGLRLDAAEAIAPDFLAVLSQHCRSLRSDFWLMGEAVFGDYRRLAGPGMLDGVTNYEAYKALYSSHASRNFHELAYCLNREFGPQGIYRGLSLYNFADNHDVNRVASELKTPAHLYPLYCLLFSMPGIPSIYYGSEWGLAARRTKYSDTALRPALEIRDRERFPCPDLAKTISRLAHIRSGSLALRYGDYQELHVAAEQFAFLRSYPGGERVVVAVNAASSPAAVDLRLPVESGRLIDLFNPGDSFPVVNHHARLDPLHPAWGRILELRRN